MFIVILSAVLGLMTLYLWKRLVKDTTAPGRTRWALTAVLLALTLLLVAALPLPRVTGQTAAGWFAWPGYLWFGLLAYLFLTLLALEPLRLVLRGWVKRRTPVPIGPVAGDEPMAPALNRRVFLARASAAAAGAASVGLVGVGAATALGPRTCCGCRSACASSTRRSMASASPWCRTFTWAHWRAAPTPSGSSG